MDGSRLGFDDVFRAEYVDVVRAIAPIVGSVSEAEAVAQDAFLKAFVRWRRLCRYDRPGAWVRRGPSAMPCDRLIASGVNPCPDLGSIPMVPKRPPSTSTSSGCWAADYQSWTDEDGCLLRIDVVAEWPGPEHCDWQRARVLIVGDPLGTPYTNAGNGIEYVRDPEGVFGEPALTAGFDPDASLPSAAADSGYRRGKLELWHVPGDRSAIWLRSPNGVEQWPAGEPPGCI